MRYCRACQEGVDCEECFDHIGYLFGWLFIWL